ncbi:unnamed protein product, partial [Brenthis ino]
MAQQNSNSTLEMGTSDQGLVAAKKTKRVTYAVGAVAMLAAIGVIITLAVVLTGNDGGSAEPIIAPTEGPTIPTTVVTPPTISTPVEPPVTTTTSTTQAPTTEPDDEIGLEEIVLGAYAAQPFNGTWVTDSEILLRNSNGDLILYDIITKTPVILVANTSQILQQSSQETRLSPDGRFVVLSFDEVTIYRYSFEARYAAIDILTHEIIYIVPPGVEVQNATLQNIMWGPSGTALIFVYENNIYYQSSLTSPPQQVTTNGVKHVVYNGVPDWVYEEEIFGDKKVIWFSSNGAKIAYATFDDTDVRIMKIPHYGVPGSVDSQYTSHRDIRYPKTGTTNPNVTVSIWDTAANTNVTFAAPTNLNEAILKAVAFVGVNSIAIMWTNRVQNTLQVDICNDATSTCATIYTYTEANGWIDNIPMIFNEQGNAFLTILPESVNGVRYKQIIQVSQANNVWTSRRRTNVAHTVQEILSWTPADTIWYKATSENDTTEQHIYSLSATDELSCFTCNVARSDGGQCLYNEANISPGSRIAIHCAGPDIPQIFIYDVNGTLINVWEDNSLITQFASKLTMPIKLRRTVPLGVGLPDADVLLTLPSNYLTRSDVPLLIYVYGGPDTSAVTKQWSIDWGTSLVSRYGIAVARVDGRGSGLRGVDHAFAVNRRLGTVEIEDQIAVARYLQQNTQWVDRNRTCIWGWSYGGYAASMALARGGDVFSCGIAVAPVVDWRYYDTIYTERYMDVPQNNAQSYVNSSLLAEDVLEGFINKKYLLVHGTEDDNVHYQHSMLLSRALQIRDIYFNQMTYTDEDHSLIGVWLHFYHSLEKFLKENMFN